jgi:hypothetical protein
MRIGAEKLIPRKFGYLTFVNTTLAKARRDRLREFICIDFK